MSLMTPSKFKVNIAKVHYFKDFENITLTKLFNNSRYQNYIHMILKGQLYLIFNITKAKLSSLV